MRLSNARGPAQISARSGQPRHGIEISRLDAPRSTMPTRPAQAADFDRAISRTWRLCCAGLITGDEAGRWHHALIALRDGREVP